MGQTTVTIIMLWNCAMLGAGQEALGHYQKAIDLLKTLPDEAQVPEFTHALVQQYGSVLLEEKGYEKVAEMADDPWIQRHVYPSWSLNAGDCLRGG